MFPGQSFPSHLLPAPFAVFEKVKFYALAVALIFYVVSFYNPAFPFSEDMLLQIVLGILSLFGVNAELKARLMTSALMRQGMLATDKKK